MALKWRSARRRVAAAEKAAEELQSCLVASRAAEQDALAELNKGSVQRANVAASVQQELTVARALAQRCMRTQHAVHAEWHPTFTMTSRYYGPLISYPSTGQKR